MESGGGSGASASKARHTSFLVELTAAKHLAAAAESERDQARRDLTQHQKRPLACGTSKVGSASDPTTAKGKGAMRGGKNKRGNK